MIGVGLHLDMHNAILGAHVHRRCETLRKSCGDPADVTATRENLDRVSVELVVGASYERRFTLRAGRKLAVRLGKREQRIRIVRRKGNANRLDRERGGDYGIDFNSVPSSIRNGRSARLYLSNSNSTCFAAMNRSTRAASRSSSVHSGAGECRFSLE